MTDAGVPSAPTAVNASAGDTTATVTWTQPSDYGTSPITSYIVSGGVSPVTVTTGTNLATNPSTEFDITGWDDNSADLNLGAAITRSTVRAWDGNASTRIVTAGVDQQGAAYHTTGLTSSATYTASAYVYIESGSAVYIASWDGVGGGVLGTNVSVTGAWTRLTVTQALAPTTTSLSVEFLVYGTSITTFHVDGLQVQTGSSATAFVNRPPTTAEITELTNGTPYTFTVTAQNSSGSSPASTPSAPVTPTGGATGLAVRATSTPAAGVGSSFTVTKPAGTATGDVLLAFQTSDGQDFNSMSAPAGFTMMTQLDGGQTGLHSVIWKKLATASEPASYTFTAGTNAATDHVVVHMVAVTGADWANTRWASTSQTASTTHACPTITPVGTADLLLTFVAAGGGAANNFSTPAGMTELGDAQASTSWCSAQIASQALTSGSATGTRTTTSIGSYISHNYSIILTPPQTRPVTQISAGIDSTGATDVTAAIQSAINALSNGQTLRFTTNGTYQILGTLNVNSRSNITIDGNGATFVAPIDTVRDGTLGSATRSHWSTNGSTGIVFKNMTIQGANPNYSNGSCYIPGWEWQFGINIVSCTNIEIANVSCGRTYGDAFYIDGAGSVTGCEDIYIHDCTITSAGRMGIAGMSVTGLHIERTSFDNVAIIAIDIEPDVDKAPVVGLNIVGNTFNTHAVGLSASFPSPPNAALTLTGYFKTSFTYMAWNTFAGTWISALISSDRLPAGTRHDHVTIAKNTSDTAFAQTNGMPIWFNSGTDCCVFGNTQTASSTGQRFSTTYACCRIYVYADTLTGFIAENYVGSADVCGRLSMADPTVVQSKTGAVDVGTATVSITFNQTATAGNLLVLVISSNDVTTGTPAGYTLSTGCSLVGQQGHYLYWKISNGTESSVSYTIGSASVSVWALLEFNNISAYDISNGTTANLHVTTYTTPTVVPTSGRRFAIATISGMIANDVLTDVSTWTNGYTEVAQAVNTVASGPQEIFAVATLALDGDGVTGTSTGANFDPSAVGSQTESAILAVFRVATAGTAYTRTIPDPVGITDPGQPVQSISTIGGGDPTVRQSKAAAVNTATATNTVTFNQTAATGNLLVLVVGSDATVSTPSGWTSSAGTAQVQFEGHYLWWRISTGTETQVQYVLTTASVSAYAFLEFTSIAAAPYDVSNGQNAVGSPDNYATPAVVPTAGRRLAIASIGGTQGSPFLLTGVSGWTNSYVEVADVHTTPTAGRQQEIGVATLTLTADGIASTSTAATFEGDVGDGPSGIIAVFKVAAGTGVQRNQPEQVQASDSLVISPPFTTFTNRFEGISSGTAVSTGNSGGASGNAFDAVAIPTAGTLAADNVHAHAGTVGLKVATSTTAGACYVQWSTSFASATRLWVSLPLYMTAGQNVRLFEARNASGVCAGVALTAGRTIQGLTSTAAAAVATVNALPVNQWVRIEASFVFDGAAGEIEVWTYPSDGTVPDEYFHATTLNTGGPATIFRFGSATSLANVTAYWLDDIQLSGRGKITTDTGVLRPVNDSVGLVDQPSQPFTASQAFAESSAATDAVASLRFQDRQLSDAAGLTDGIVQQVTTERDVLDSIAPILDPVEQDWQTGVGGDQTRDIPDSLTITDTGSPYSVDYGEFTTDSVGETDPSQPQYVETPTAPTNWVVPVNDNVGCSDVGGIIAVLTPTGPQNWLRPQTEPVSIYDSISVNWFHPVHLPSTRTTRKIWTLPAVLVYAPLQRVENGLYQSLGLTQTADKLTVVQVGSVTYAVEPGTGLPVGGG